MTLPKPIRMTPSRLPPLTRAQDDKIRTFRRLFAGHGKVSILRKGQKPGYVLMKGEYKDQTVNVLVSRSGHVVDRWYEDRIPGLDTAETQQPTNQTNPFTEE